MNNATITQLASDGGARIEGHHHAKRWQFAPSHPYSQSRVDRARLPTLS
jgi:hypothetical protein